MAQEEGSKNGDKQNKNAAPKVDTNGHDNMHSGAFYKSPSMSKLSHKNDVLVISQKVLNSITRPVTNIQSIWDNENSPKSTTPESLDKSLRHLATVSISPDKSGSTNDEKKMETEPVRPISKKKEQEFISKIDENFEKIKNSVWMKGDDPYRVRVPSNNKVYMVRKYEKWSSNTNAVGQPSNARWISQWEYKDASHKSASRDVNANGVQFTEVDKVYWHLLRGDDKDPEGLNDAVDQMIKDEVLKQLVRLHAADILEKMEEKRNNKKKTAFVDINSVILGNGIVGKDQLLLVEPDILSNGINDNIVRRNSFGKNRDHASNMKNDNDKSMGSVKDTPMASAKNDKKGNPNSNAHELDENDYNQYLYGLGNDNNDYGHNGYEKAHGLPMYEHGWHYADNSNDGVNTLQSSMMVLGVMELFGVLILLCIISVCLAALVVYHYGNKKDGNPSLSLYDRMVIKSDNDTPNDHVV